MIEIETPEVDIVTTNTGITVETPSIETEVVDLNDLSITVSKKEYTIVGDDIYIPVLYDDAPQWMKDLVQIVVDVSVETGNTATLAELTAMLNNFAVSYVPLNQYTQTILELGDEDTRINGVLTTLNSNFNDGLSNANAQIIDLALTKASKTEVVAQVVQTLAAQLADETSNLGAVVGNLEQAIANETSARALSMTALTASLEDTELGVTANATATQTLNVYVGVDPSGGLTGTGLLADVAILQKQNDGVIETVTGTYDVMLNDGSETTAELVVGAEPYATWKAADVTGVATRTAHIGDVYIKYTVDPSGAKEYAGSYKFIRTTVDATSPYSTDVDGFTWARVVDSLAESAYIAALNAKDLADGKRRVYVGLGATATPTIPYEVGDLWLIDVARIIDGYSAKVGDILRCVENKTASIATYEANDWVLASSYANAVQAEIDSLESWKTTTYANTISSLQTQLDKKAETFYLNSVPSGRLTLTNVAVNTTLDGYVGDLWKNTYVGTVDGYLGNNTEYIYTKTANGANWDYKWTKMEVPDIVFDTIDTKKTIFTGNTLPVTPEVNDMWVTGDAPVDGRDPESIYVWDGTLWVIPVKYTDDTTVVALENGLANGTVEVNLANAYVEGTLLSTYLSNELDGLVVVYSGTDHTSQVGMKTNDIYIEKTTAVGSSGISVDVVNTWKYNGTIWVQIGNNNNLTALADLADGKRSVFSGSVFPTGANERDIWIPSADVTVTTSTNCTLVGGTWTSPNCSIPKLLKGEIYQYLSGVWGATTRYTADIKSLTDNVQTQIDGKVDTYYQSTVPMYKPNSTTPLDAKNNGDYWYCTDTIVGPPAYTKGSMYKYTHPGTWTFTSDVTKYAFDLADGKASIFTTSAQPSSYKINDMMIVTTTSFSNGTTTFSEGVVLTSSMDRTAGFVASDWSKKINDTEKLDAFVSVIEPKVTRLKDQVDGKYQSWFTLSTVDPRTAAGYWAKYSTNVVPTGAVTGDVWWTTGAVSSYLANKYYVKQSNGTWLDSTTGIRLEHDSDMWYQTNTKLSYRYGSDSNAWELIGDSSVIAALAAASAAQGAVDDVVVSFYAIKQDTAPATTSMWLNKTGTKVLQKYTTSWEDVDVKVGDTLTAYDPTTKDVSIYVYNGTGWITNTENGMVSSSEAITTLDNDLTSLGSTVGGHTSQLNTVDTRIANGVATVETKWAYNSTVNINGVYKKSGFGLTTNYTSGSGTVGDPYVSEFWIDASRLKFTNSATTGRTSPFTIDASGTTPQITFNGVVNFSNVNGASANTLSTLGVVNAYSNTNASTLSFDTTQNAIKLYSSTDINIGCAFKAFPVNNGIGEVFTISIRVKSNVVSTTGLYIRVYEYNANLPAGKTHVSNDAVNSSSVVVEDTSAKTNWCENSSVSTQWTTYTYKYTPTTGAKWASVVLVNATDLGLNPIWIKDLEIISSIPNVAAAVNAGTTTISGGKIEALSIKAAQIASDSITADKLSVTSLSSITANLGTITSGVIYDSTWNGSTYKMKIDLTNGRIYIK